MEDNREMPMFFVKAFYPFYIKAESLKFYDGLKRKVIFYGHLLGNLTRLCAVLYVTSITIFSQEKILSVLGNWGEKKESGRNWKNTERMDWLSFQFRDYKKVEFKREILQRFQINSPRVWNTFPYSLSVFGLKFPHFVKIMLIHLCYSTFMQIDAKKLLNV